MLIASKDTSIFFEGGFAAGHRIADCSNQQTYDFYIKAVEKLKMKEGQVKAIPWSQINNIRQPRGWLWIPRPYLNKEKLLTLIKMQNTGYDTRKWAIVIEGKQKQYGQHFLLKIGRESLPKLVENNMVIRAGLCQSKVVLEGNATNIVAEPDTPATVISRVDASDTGNGAGPSNKPASL